MRFKRPRFKPAKHCLYGLKIMVFISLLIGCYFQYMKSALEDYFKNSITVVVRSEEITQYEAPAIIVCANYDYKPSVQINHKFDFPTRNLFQGKILRFLAMEDPKQLDRVYDLFQNRSVEELFNDYTYANDLMFIGDSENLKIVSFNFIGNFIEFPLTNFHLLKLFKSIILRVKLMSQKR